MKPKLFLSLSFITALFLATGTNALAACDANIASFDEGTRNLTVCIGGFSSPTELRASTAHINCLDNSNLLGTGCLGVTGPANHSLAETPNSTIAQANDGTYYTCPVIQGVNRAVGKINISVSGSQSCKTPDAIIKPGNWNAALEGNLAGQAGQALGIPTPGNITANAAGCVASDGTQGINTALGCISFDATRGGFIKSLLSIAIGLGGGVALLLILYGVFIVTTSAGIPEKLKSGNEIITSAVAGLIFIIMAIFLMNLVGIKILAIPGLQ